MKIHLLYTYFNGFEQLEYSLLKMYELFDKVTICYQVTSNKGNRRSGIMYELMNLKKRFKNIDFILFEPDLKLNTKQNERNKHQLMIEHARECKSTHFVLSACDHVYTKDHLEYALDFHQKHPYVDVSLTEMYTYYKEMTWRLEPIESYWMPFIHVLRGDTAITLRNPNYTVKVDPSVITNASTIVLFQHHEAILHHYSMVRTDINSKFDNACASIRWTPKQVEIFKREYENAKIGDSITYFQGRKLIDVSQ